MSFDENEGVLFCTPRPISHCLFSVAKGSMSGVSVAPDNFLPRDEFVGPDAPVGPIEGCSTDAARVLKPRSMEREKQCRSGSAGC